MADRAAFRQEVRQALQHLYDYERLQKSPLSEWLQAEPGYSGEGTLRQILLAGIDELKPEAGVPIGAPAWRPYHILFYRFVQGMSVGEVASQLGFGERHFRRHQARAIRALADNLWERRIRSAELTGDELGQQADVDANLAWLQSEQAPPLTDLGEVLAGVEELLDRLLKAHGVVLALKLPESLPPLDIHPLAMRQALASALSYAAGLAPGGRIEIQGQAVEGVMVLRFTPHPARSLPAGAAPPEMDASSIPQRLLGMYDGSLEITSQPGGLPTVTIQVPVVRRLPVLIVDDNADTARLFARYLADSRYQPVIARSSDEALTLAQEHQPCAVVLDVMMPDRDGWEVLSLLQAHPLTGEIPVIVATILSDRELALSLGAAEFLHKPVSQADLLAALDRRAG